MNENQANPAKIADWNPHRAVRLVSKIENESDAYFILRNHRIAIEREVDEAIIFLGESTARLHPVVGGDSEEALFHAVKFQIENAMGEDMPENVEKMFVDTIRRGWFMRPSGRTFRVQVAVIHEIEVEAEDHVQARRAALASLRTFNVCGLPVAAESTFNPVGPGAKDVEDAAEGWQYARNHFTAIR